MAKKRLFSADNRARILAQVVGKPTGVKAEIGGIEIDLLPFNTEEGLAVFALLRKFADLFEDMRAGKVTEASLARAVGAEGETILGLIRSVIKRSANVEGDEEEQLFNQWFASLELIATVKALAPKVIAANGIGELLGNGAAAQAAPQGEPQQPALVAVP